MAKVNWEIEHSYDAECIMEISVAVNGNSYLVIFGKHINGGFCSIPNWGAGVSCRAMTISVILATTLRELAGR